MTDITDQDKRDALAWAGGSQAIGIADAAARVILATVEAPAPTLAEEIMRLPDFTMSGDHCLNDCHDHAGELAERVQQIEDERDQARAEVERLTAERDGAREEIAWLRNGPGHTEVVTDPSLNLNDTSMTGTVAREENVAPDLHNPADVKPGEAWLVNIDGVEIVPGFKASVGWICYRLFDGTTKAIGDERITLVSRLVTAPRIITDTDELERLAATSIIRDGRGWPGGITDQGVTMINGFCVSDEEVLGHGPVMVLWEPGE